MRKTIVAAALATATLAAPAAADCLACVGHVAPGNASVALTGRAAYPNNRLAARCTYDGAALHLDVTATGDAGAHISLDGECILFSDEGAWGINTWAEGSGPVARLAETRGDLVYVNSRMLCLNVGASWQSGYPDEDWLSLYRCVEIGAWASGGGAEVEVPGGV